MSTEIIAQEGPDRKPLNLHEWERRRLIVPTDDGSSIIEVDALMHGWVAVRKGNTAGRLHRRAWLAFYVPNGLAFATADTREEACRVALAFKPVFRRMINEFMTLVKVYDRTGRVPLLSGDDSEWLTAGWQESEGR